MSKKKKIHGGHWEACLGILGKWYVALSIWPVLYDQFHVNVQKSISHHKHECNIGAAKTGLTRMYVMKIQYFHEYPDLLPKPVIPYGDTLMKQSKLCTMYLNLNAQKALDTRNQY